MLSQSSLPSWARICRPLVPREPSCARSHNDPRALRCSRLVSIRLTPATPGIAIAETPGRGHLLTPHPASRPTPENSQCFSCPPLIIYQKPVRIIAQVLDEDQLIVRRSFPCTDRRQKGDAVAAEFDKTSFGMQRRRNDAVKLTEVRVVIIHRIEFVKDADKLRRLESLRTAIDEVLEDLRT
jgi:hypothetical protein